MQENYEETTYNPSARLCILKALAAQTDYRLNDHLILKELSRFAFNKGRGFVKNQLRWLEKEAGAVRLTEAGSALIAELTETGLDHVERRQVLDGVARPSPAGG